MRRAARVDANQSATIEAFRMAGCTVLPLHTVGAGCPDLLVAKHGVNVLVECKAGKNGLTGDQEKFHAEWKGPIFTVRNIGDVVAVCMGMMRD